MMTPICLFTFNRLNETKQTIDALKKNFLAPESNLFIFSDGARNDKDLDKIEAVRKYLKSVTGFKTIKIIESNENKGLATSIINGVTEVLSEYENVIVLEDDLITSHNFLNYMNLALLFYQNDLNIQSISGYSLLLSDKSNEVNFQTRTFSWGWGTWKNRWNPNIFDKKRIKVAINSSPGILNKFKQKCGADMPKMLLDSLSGKNDSWYIRWTFDHFMNKHYAVFPSYSFVTNIGHNLDATHCKGINTYISKPVNQNKTEFNFPAFYPPHQQSNSEFLSYFSLKHKILIRIKLLKTQTGRKQIFKEVKMKMGL